MFSIERLDKLCLELTKSGKKLEILLRQIKTFDRVESETESSFKMGILPQKDYRKNMSRIGREKAHIENKTKELLESLIKEILKST